MPIPYSSWLALPLSTRIKIAEVMGIPKLRSTHVANDQVLDDGYNVKDVEEAIKVVPMQDYLESKETDVFILFQNLVDDVNGVEEEKEEEFKTEEELESEEEEKVEPEEKEEEVEPKEEKPVKKPTKEQPKKKKRA